MAMGRRRWGRQPQQAAEAGKLAASGVGAVRDASHFEDLTVRASWPALPAEIRESLLLPFDVGAAPAPRRADRILAGIAAADERTRQDWLTALLESSLQRSAISVIQTWLTGGASDAHLAVNGSAGRGRTTAVSALARRAMRGRLAAPDYCYVPDAEAPAHWEVLALPAGTGMGFCEALNGALHQIAQRWEKVRDQPHGEGTEYEADSSAVEKLVREHLGRLSAKASEPASAYLERLMLALVELRARVAFPIGADADCPAGRLEQERAAAVDVPPEAAVAVAPVVVASLARSEITRMLLRANGGVLIISAGDLVERDQPTNEWSILRTVLRTGFLAMRPAGEPLIPVDVRVALIGSALSLRVLERSEEFARLFRYRAAFEESTAWTLESEAAYAELCAGVSRVYGVPPFDHAAVGALIEEGARRTLGYNRSRLTTDLALLRDVGVEAGQHARAREREAGGAAGSDTLAGVTTTAADVDAVLATRREVYGRHAREAREDILSGREIVPTAGSVIGTINGLTVMTVYPAGAESRFGAPFRLTVTVTPGRERLVDVEREADHADNSHVAGALTMAGFLAWRYGHDRPIHTVVRLRFEQGGSTAGPSASAAELFALLSALAAVPIRRCLAVTGAVGQHGEVQAIGGVSEKVEGFWQICRARRQRGETPDSAYGVLIPAANLADLLLRSDVAQAIADEGWFHIWPITDVDEGIPLLTGMPAAAVHARVDATLARYYHLAASDPASRS